MPELFRVVEHTVNCSHSREYVGATANGDADRPQLAVKQYIPLDNPKPQPGDVTIIGAHANGFPKVSRYSSLRKLLQLFERKKKRKHSILNTPAGVI